MKFSELIEELKSLSNEGIYTRGKIDWWLLKHELRYISLSRDFDTLKVEFPKADIHNHKMLKKESQFIKLYEKLLEVSDYHRNNENYQEPIDLNKIINDIKY
ncbi:hypothetical protein ACFFU9_01265 [Mariniflexile ostreae]|uniref:Uncharacterized protein n=1 Tax=Mariniflexile ostreae TaxID=1520892 RepID=A0ABV5F7D7_9FLAO